ncbi:unnamed protein product [Amoebophrya sp. A25]|nr:unnamed protein product [Amoebophrya sp. A25]|eukprot:GSA25T00002671001.1
MAGGGASTISSSSNANTAASTTMKQGTNRFPPVRRATLRLPSFPNATELDSVLWKALENARLNSLKGLSTNSAGTHGNGNINTEIGVPARTANGTNNTNNTVVNGTMNNNKRIKFASHAHVRFHDDEWAPDKYVMETGVNSKDFDGQSQHRSLHFSVPKRVLDTRALFQLAISMSVQRKGG